MAALKAGELVALRAAEKVYDLVAALVCVMEMMKVVGLAELKDD